MRNSSLRFCTTFVLAILNVALSALSGLAHSTPVSVIPQTGILALKPVVQTFTTHPDQLYHLVARGGRNSASDNDDPEARISATAGHPLRVVGKQAFVPVSELQAGDTFLTRSGQYQTLESIRIERAPAVETFTTYNFEVADFHTYFAGRAEFWVHNRGNACERLFSLIDRRARALGKTHEGTLESLRFQALKDVKAKAFTQRGFDGPWWSRFTTQNTKKMLADYRAGKFASIDDYPSVKQWRNEYFKTNGQSGFVPRKGKHANVEVHHSVEKYIQEKLQIPAQFRDECPGIPMLRKKHADGDIGPFHGGKAEDGGLAATMRTTDNIPTNMPFQTTADRQLIVNNLRRVYEDRGLGTDDY